VENEAHSFSLLQALLCRRFYAPRAKVVVSIWANQRLTGIKGIALNILARLMRPGVDYFIAGSAQGRALLAESGVPAGRMAVFPMGGTDVDYYTPAPPEERARLRREIGIAPDEFLIGFVGRFVLDKGIPDLMLAFRQLREQAHGARPRLLCVGDGPLKKELLALQPEVLVASPGGSGAVLRYYRAMDVLVLPSRTMLHWKEQFGRVLIEAMATGVPVIGSSSGEIPNVVGNAGMVFPEKDVTSLVNALNLLANDPHLKSACALKGRERVIGVYSDKRICEQTLQTYSRLLGAGSPGRWG
jgi:glycosyltransferase involved in cell wall biosynthesis